MCNNAEVIVGYVYGELPDAECRDFETHLARCADCRHEANELRATRGHLASWAPPEPDFGFRIIRGANAPAPAPRRFAFAPAWGLAAAAVLVLAAAAAIANVEIRYDANGMVVRTGWARDAAVPQDAAAVGGAITTVSVTPAQIAALETRLRELEAAAAAREAAGETQLALGPGPRMTESEIIRLVREIVSRSETRQQREFATQIAQVVKEVDRARQMDYAQFQQGLVRMRSTTQADVAQQLNRYLTLVSHEK